MDLKLRYALRGRKDVPKATAEAPTNVAISMPVYSIRNRYDPSLGEQRLYLLRDGLILERCGPDNPYLMERMEALAVEMNIAASFEDCHGLGRIFIALGDVGGAIARLGPSRTKGMLEIEYRTRSNALRQLRREIKDRIPAVTLIPQDLRDDPDEYGYVDSLQDVPVIRRVRVVRGR